MLLSKKSLASLTLATLCGLVLAVPAFAAVKGGPFLIRPTDRGDMDFVNVFLGSGVDDITIDADYSGIHSGQKADITWRIINSSGEVEREVRKINQDFDGVIQFRDLDNPGGDYQVEWESNTNNDTQGGFYVIITSGEVMQ